MTPSLVHALPGFIMAMGLAAASCSDGVVAERDRPQATAASVVLPAGDHDAGRQAFLDLKCGTCHAVPSEPSFAAPLSANPGPPIDARVGRQDMGYLITAIATPSHGFSPSVSPETGRQPAGTLSPMGDISAVMTVRQLVDLHAYVRSRTE